MVGSGVSNSKLGHSIIGALNTLLSPVINVHARHKGTCSGTGTCLLFTLEIDLLSLFCVVLGFGNIISCQVRGTFSLLLPPFPHPPVVTGGKG